MKRSVALSVAAVWLALIAAIDAQAPQVGSGQSIDIAVTRYVVDRTGDPIGLPAQTIRYRVSRVRTDAGWKTTMTLGAPDGMSHDQVARNPFFGGRAEFDETGAFAMFDNTGRAVAAPPGLRVPRVPMVNADWSAALDGISTTAPSREARVRDVEATYGPSARTVRGLSQHVRRQGEFVEELLFDRERGVPVELNIMAGDRLTAHVTFAYVERPGGGLFRRAMRSEAVLNEEGHRAVTATEFSNAFTAQEW